MRNNAKKTTAGKTSSRVEHALFGSTPEEAARRRFEALHSAFMRVPHFNVGAARDLLDLGFTQLHQIAGRAPETLLADLLKKRPNTPPERLAEFRLAVYVAETPEPDRLLLHPA
ncbi:MAG: hypothetical protein LBS59_01780, partial [Puniceicoccales bacterium]|nr:hypothetical protein [Puniceicoccales bacterium]